MGYSPWGGKESARTEHTHTHRQFQSLKIWDFLFIICLILEEFLLPGHEFLHFYKGETRKWKRMSRSRPELQHAWHPIEPQPNSSRLCGGAGGLELRDTACRPQPRVWQLLPSGKAIGQRGQKNPWEQGIQSRPIWREDFVRIIWKVKRDFLFFGLRSRNKKGYQAKLSLPSLLKDHMSRQKCHFHWCKCEGVGTLGIKFLLKYTCFWKKKKKHRALDSGNAKLLGNCSKPDPEGIKCHWPFRVPLMS